MPALISRIVFTVFSIAFSFAIGSETLAQQIAQNITQPNDDLNKVVDVGVILPLSGDAASFGAGIKNGIDFAYERLNPQARARLRLHFEDDRLDPRLTILAFHKLRADYKISLVINGSSGTGNALAPIADEAGIPLLSMSTDPRVSKGRKFVMNFWTTSDEQVRTFVPEVVRRQYKRLARVSSIHDWAEISNQILDQQLIGKAEIVIDEGFNPSDKDFKSFLTKVRSRKDLDAIVVVLLPGQAGLFAKQARQMGIQLPLAGFEAFEDKAELDASAGALLGQWYVNADDPNSTFFSDYGQRFPNQTRFAAGHAYDALNMISEIVGRATAPLAINEQLHAVKDFHGVTGTFSANAENRFTLPAAIKIVTKDGFEKLS